MVLRPFLGVIHKVTRRWTNGNRNCSSDDDAIRIVDPLSGLILSEFPLPGSPEEGEGITIWDLSQFTVPNGFSGQFHFQEETSHTLGNDSYWFQHWCANDLSKL